MVKASKGLWIFGLHRPSIEALEILVPDFLEAPVDDDETIL